MSRPHPHERALFYELLTHRTRIEGDGLRRERVEKAKRAIANETHEFSSDRLVAACLLRDEAALIAKRLGNSE